MTYFVSLTKSSYCNSAETVGLGGDTDQNEGYLGLHFLERIQSFSEEPQEIGHSLVHVVEEVQV